MVSFVRGFAFKPHKPHKALNPKLPKYSGLLGFRLHGSQGFALRWPGGRDAWPRLEGRSAREYSPVVPWPRGSLMGFRV